MFILLVLLLFAPGVASNQAYAATSALTTTVKTAQCPQNWFYSLEMDKCYYISHDYASFDNATSYCSSVNHAEMVSIYSKREYDIVSVYLEQQAFADTFPAWIGLRTYRWEPWYRWLDETPANFTQFVNGTSPSNPNDYDNSCFGWLKTRANDGWIVVDCQNPLPFICKRHVPSDDIIVNGNNGKITSPKYPFPYDPSVTTYYYITVPSENVIELTFSFMGIDSESYISIYDGSNANEKLLYNITSSNRQSVITSTSHEMMIVFVASGTSGGNYFGWAANFNAVIPTALTGAWTSPNYPADYDNNENIVRTVRVPENFGFIFYLWNFCVKPGDYLRFEFMDGTSYYTYDKCLPIVHQLIFSVSEAKVTWFTDGQGTSSGFNMTWAANPL